MARMSIDDSVGRDPRITALAADLGISRAEAVGHLVASVWPICYDQKTAIIVGHLVDLATGISGFAQAMIRSGLATATRGKRIRIRGATHRVEYLLDAAEYGRIGGLKSGKVRADKSRVGRSHPEGSTNLSSPDLPSASAPDPVTPKEREETRACAREGSLSLSSFRERVEANGTAHHVVSPPASDAELDSVRAVLAKLTKHNGVTYTGHRDHTRLIVERLRDGFTEQDLRLVVGYCALNLGWESEEKMRPHLRPETLFADGKITKYIEPARAWLAEIEAEESRAAP